MILHFKTNDRYLNINTSLENYNYNPNERSNIEIDERGLVEIVREMDFCGFNYQDDLYSVMEDTDISF